MGLFIAAAITTVLAIAVIGGLIWWIAEREHRRVLALAFVVALPLQPLVFYMVRVPLFGFLAPEWPMPNWMRILALLLLAPLTEEPAKWLALAAVRRALRPGNAVAFALAIGLGFGTGEIWFVAHTIAASPNFPDLPFWMFNGFLLERLEVCFLHSEFVLLPIACLVLGRPFWHGALAGMALHFLANFPIYLAQIDLFEIGQSAWAQALILWIAALVVAGVILMKYFHARFIRVAGTTAAQ
jgi:hypothetical protein